MIDITTLQSLEVGSAMVSQCTPFQRLAPNRGVEYVLVSIEGTEYRFRATYFGVSLFDFIGTITADQGDVQWALA